MSPPKEGSTVSAKRPFPVRLLAFGGAAVGAVLYGFLWHSPAQAGLLLQHYGYYAMLAAFAWWLYATCRVVAAEGVVQRALSPGGLWRHRAAWGTIIGLTVVALLTVPYSYKILYDELVLQSTAMSLHFFREVGTIVRGYEIEGMFRSLDVYVDKRPIFYPFLVSLIHDLTGFRVVNAYLLNTALMPVVLGLLYSVARRLGGRGPGLAALICFGATPLLAQNANGTGMEMLNLAMILVTLVSAVYYLETPDERRLSALVLAAVLLAQTRYESAVYVVPVAVVIIEGWRRAGRLVLPIAAICAPLLLIPCALHNVYLSGTPVLWELNENTTVRFGAVFFGKNLSHAMQYFFSVTSGYLNSPFLAVFGFAAMGWVGWRLMKSWRGWKTADPLLLATLLISCGALVNLGLLMFYYWGQLTDPLVFRMALPVNMAQALAIAWIVSRLPVDSWRSRVVGWLVAGGLLAYAGFGLQANESNGSVNQIATELTWGQEWVSRQPPKSRLIISNKSTLNWLIEKSPCLNLPYARGRALQVAKQMANGTFKEVLVFQYYRPSGPEGGFVLDPRDALPSSYVLEPVAERQFGAKFMRISRVVAIKLDEAAKADRTLLIGGLWVANVESSVRPSSEKIAVTTATERSAPATEAGGHSEPAAAP